MKLDFHMEICCLNIISCFILQSIQDIKVSDIETKFIQSCK